MARVIGFPKLAIANALPAIVVVHHVSSPQTHAQEARLSQLAHCRVGIDTQIGHQRCSRLGRDLDQSEPTHDIACNWYRDAGDQPVLLNSHDAPLAASVSMQGTGIESSNDVTPT